MTTAASRRASEVVFFASLTGVVPGFVAAALLWAFHRTALAEVGDVGSFLAGVGFVALHCGLLLGAIVQEVVTAVPVLNRARFGPDLGTAAALVVSALAVPYLALVDQSAVGIGMRIVLVGYGVVAVVLLLVFGWSRSRRS